MQPSDTCTRPGNRPRTSRPPATDDGYAIESVDPHGMRSRVGTLTVREDEQHD